MSIEQVKVIANSVAEAANWRHMALGGVLTAAVVAPTIAYNAEDALAQDNHSLTVAEGVNNSATTLALERKDCQGTKQYKSRVVFHRGTGANGIAGIDENTPGSARWAVKHGAGTAETDFQMTKDNKLLVLHNPTLNAGTNLTGDVSRYTLDELQQKGRYNDGTKLASNRDWYQAIAGSCMKAWSELKPEGITQEGVIEALSAANDTITDPKRVTFTSSGIGILCKVSNLDNDIHQTAKIETTDGWPSLAKIKKADCGIDGVNVAAAAITPARIKAAQEAGLYVSAREVKNMHQIKLLDKAGVEYFVINPNEWSSVERNKLVSSKFVAAS